VEFSIIILLKIKQFGAIPIFSNEKYKYILKKSNYFFLFCIYFAISFLEFACRNYPKADSEITLRFSVIAIQKPKRMPQVDMPID